MARPKRLGRSRLVTLTSDVGSVYAAQMKAVLARSLDPARVVDLAHDLPAHAVSEAAFLVRAMAHGFPAGTVHVVVVDPGVGGRRAPVAIECRDGSVLVGPDNGVLHPLAEELGIRRTVRLDPTVWARSPRVGTTFDGRDLFAPAAALLATGTRLSKLGRPHRLSPFRLLPAVRRASGARGRVLHTDRFGNLITNVPSAWVPSGVRSVRARVGRASARSLPLARSYEALGAERAGLLASSFGLLEVSVDQGRADRRFRATTGAPVEFTWTVRPRARGTVNSARTRHR